ncbi:non-hydrolyzing UDP-N-acetylglucosamine 2-epimerase [Deferrisoma palaeochoriense]
MKRQKILILAGTRPEAVKMAPIILALRKLPDEFEVTVCSTGQHRAMLDQAFADFDIYPDIDLQVMEPNQTLARLTQRLLAGIDDVLSTLRPDWMLVQGDTTTVLTGSLCAFYQGVKVGHVEAGLRSWDIRQPFPEEMNRRVASLVATLHFSPTALAKQNLLREGVPEARVVVTGNTVVDALMYILSDIKKRPPELPFNLNKLLESYSGFVLITGHRRESFGKPFEEICLAIRELAMRFTQIAFVYPVHLNPNVRKPVWDILGEVRSVLLVDPLSYKQFIYLMAKSLLVLTDSGGVQEEAPSLGKPLLVMRGVTERPEGVKVGVAKVIGTRKDDIVRSVSEVLERLSNSGPFTASGVNPYGDGRAADRIVAALLEHSNE